MAMPQIIDLEPAEYSRFVLIALLVAFPLIGLIVRRWWATLLPVIGWPAF